MRKLSFKETILISKILHDVEIKDFVKDFKDTLNKIESKDLNQLYSILGLELIAYIATNMFKSEENILELLVSYSNKSEIDVDDIFNTFKMIWENGLPDMISKLFTVDKQKKT